MRTAFQADWAQRRSQNVLLGRGIPIRVQRLACFRDCLAAALSFQNLPDLVVVFLRHYFAADCFAARREAPDKKKSHLSAVFSGCLLSRHDGHHQAWPRPLVK